MRSVMRLSCSALLVLAGSVQPGAADGARSAEQYGALAETLKETGAQLEVPCDVVLQCGRTFLSRLIGCTCTGSVFAARRGFVCCVWKACSRRRGA